MSSEQEDSLECGIGDPLSVIRAKMNGRVLARELWRSYIVLLIANELDLVYTYFGLSRGAFLEWNPWLRPHLLTWWPIGVKVGCLAALAVGIIAIVRAGSSRQQRVLRALRVATAVYATVLVLHVVNLLTSLSGG